MFVIEFPTLMGLYINSPFAIKNISINIQNLHKKPKSERDKKDYSEKKYKSINKNKSIK